MTAPFHVLIVDDDRDAAEHLSAVPTRGTSTEFAPEAHCALERVGGGTYDVMLTDIEMPGMNGVWIIRQDDCPALPYRHRHLLGL